MRSGWRACALAGVVAVGPLSELAWMQGREFLRIGRHEDGIAYFASPRSAPPTPFRLIETGARRVVFENKRHDFPQRILYWLDPDGRLHARIEGTRGGRTLSEEWDWAKTP
jgi:hypothetical protein